MKLLETSDELFTRTRPSIENLTAVTPPGAMSISLAIPVPFCCVESVKIFDDQASLARSQLLASVVGVFHE